MHALIILISLFVPIFQKENLNTILIKETLYIDSLKLNEDELTALIIDQYKINYSFEQTEIYSDYFNSPKNNEIYSVELIIHYKENPTIYNLKLMVNSNNKNNISDSLFLVPIFILTAFILGIVYKMRSRI